VLRGEEERNEVARTQDCSTPIRKVCIGGGRDNNYVYEGGREGNVKRNSSYPCRRRRKGDQLLFHSGHQKELFLREGGKRKRKGRVFSISHYGRNEKKISAL